MSSERQTFEHRKALLQLGGLLSDNDSKKIVFLLGLPKALEEKTPWEVLAHLEEQGKATVEELTKNLKAIDRQDVAKKAKELIGKNNRKKTTDSGNKALMLRDSLQLAMKQCKILVEQVDYLKVAANKDGNKRIEQMASEAKENLLNQVQKKLRYASALFNSQTDISASDSAESSSPTSSLESSLSDRSPDSSPPLVRSRITASELKEAAEKLKQRKGNLLHSNPHAIWRRITGSELKKAAEKLQNPQKESSPPQTIHRSQSGTGAPIDRQHIPLPNKPQDAQIASAHQAQDEEEDPYTLPDDEDPYTLPKPVEATPQQNTISTYENVPRDLPRPIACSENQPEIGYSNTIKVSGAKSHTTVERSTDDASSADEYSCSTCSYTGDSGFSDSRAFLKEIPSGSHQLAHYQREQGSGIDSSAGYTSLTTTDVHTGRYTSLNLESRISDVIYTTSEQCQSSSEHD